MPYNLGVKPDKLKVNLYRDADFDSVLTRQDETGAEAAWGNSDIRLVFLSDKAEWPAVVEGSRATFQVDKAETNLRLNAEKVELWVGDQCWAAGTVTRKGL